MAKYRQQKVSHEIMRVLSGALRCEVQDPRVSDVTITDVSISSDLSIASVRWLCPKNVDREEAAAGLSAAASFLRTLLGQQIALRRVPSIRFFYDESYEHGEHIAEVLNKLRAEGQMGENDGI